MNRAFFFFALLTFISACRTVPERDAARLTRQIAQACRDERREPYRLGNGMRDGQSRQLCQNRFHFDSRFSSALAGTGTATA